MHCDDETCKTVRPKNVFLECYILCFFKLAQLIRAWQLLWQGHGFDPCMDQSLNSWPWWSLWVPSSSKYSVILWNNKWCYPKLISTIFLTLFNHCHFWIIIIPSSRSYISDMLCKPHYAVTLVLTFSVPLFHRVRLIRALVRARVLMTILWFPKKRKEVKVLFQSQCSPFRHTRRQRWRQKLRLDLLWYFLTLWWVPFQPPPAIWAPALMTTVVITAKILTLLLSAHWTSKETGWESLGNLSLQLSSNFCDSTGWIVLWITRT